MPHQSSLVERFVERINQRPRDHQPLDEVPEFLREASPDHSPDSPIDGFTSWRIVRRDDAARIDDLEKRTARAFPPSFRYLLANYSFPAFEIKSVVFFANTGEDTFWELGRRLFQDPGMSPLLLKAGFPQIGNPFFHNYDPVCFDCNAPGIEKRIVQLDHEAILIDGRMTIVRETAPSFGDLMRAELDPLMPR